MKVFHYFKLKKMKNIIFFVLLGMIFTNILQAQTAIHIVDATTEKNIPFATVKIGQQYFFADENGRLKVESSLEQAEIEVDQIGYEPRLLQLTDQLAGQIQIQLQPRSILLEEILVSDAKRNITAQSTVLQDEAKMVSQPRDIGDLLRNQTGFGIIKKGGYALDPVFRAFKYEQLNFIYDGGLQAVHACPARMDPISTHVNPAEIEKLELIRGPFSVRFGQTMGGVINVVTKPLSEQKGWGGQVETGFETNGSNKVAQLGLHYGGDKFHYALSGGIKDYGSYSNGEGEVIPSAFKAYDYSFKAGLTTQNNGQWQLSWRQSFGRDILHPGLMMDSEEDNSSILSLDYSIKNIGSSLFGLTFKAYGSQVDHIMTNSRRPNFRMLEAIADVESTTLGGKLEASWLPSKKTTLYTGIDAKYIARKGDRVRTIKRNMMTGEPLPMPMVMTDKIWQDASIQNYGVFAEYRSFFNNDWAVNLGARLDWVSAYADDPAADFLSLYGDLERTQELNFSANTSLTFSPEDSWNLQLSLGRGTRTANMIERYINHFNVGVDAFEYVGNPDLLPEANHQTELSFSFGREKSLQGSMNVFYSYITNYITAEVDESIPRKFMPNAQPRFARRFVNIDAAEQVGGELQLSYQWFPQFKTFGSLAYTRAHNLDWDEPLAEIPPLEGQLGAKYESKLAWTELRVRMVAEQNRVSAQFGENRTPGFTTVDLRAGMQPLEGLNVGVGVLNIFDVTYFEHLNRTFRNMPGQSVIFEPGRNVTVFLKYQL
jgi:iron complex outermembrane receptor protein